MREGYTAELAASFGAAAAEYERARPEYPAAVVDWIVPAGARAAVDVGAGTGKLTRALRERGVEVTAVEPLAEMRQRLEADLPEVRALAGSGERLPLGDAAVDLVTYAQAWHWVERERRWPRRRGSCGRAGGWPVSGTCATRSRAGCASSGC